MKNNFIDFAESPRRETPPGREPYTTNGFIDTDPPTIIDTGLSGIPEIGIDNNYGFGRLFKDFANAIKNYFNDIIIINPDRFEKK